MAVPLTRNAFAEKRPELIAMLAKDLRMCFLAFSSLKLPRDIVWERFSQYLVLI